MNTIRQFLNGEINVIDLGSGVILSKEVAPSSELWHLSVNGAEEKTFWVSSKPNDVKQPKKGNYTNGKPPYTMAMSNPVKTLVSDENVQGDIFTQLGVLTALGRNMEFSTGKLVNRRTKKPLTRKDILSITKFSHNKLDKILRDMKATGLIEHTADGYFVSRKYIKKGGK